MGEKFEWYNFEVNTLPQCPIKIFNGGWGGGNSERCLKWDSEGLGSLRNPSTNILK